MKKRKSAAFYASEDSTIIANGSKVTGYQYVAIAEKNSQIHIENAIITSPEALKTIESINHIISNNEELSSTDKDEIIKTLESLKFDRDSNFSEKCNKVLSISSSAVTIFPVVKASIVYLLTLVNS